MKKTITIDYIMATCKTLFNRLTSYISNPVILQMRNSTPSFQQIATLKRAQYIKNGIPEPPKRPKSAFFVFRDIEYPQIKKDNPELKVKDIMRIIGTKWAEYPEEKKELIKQETQNAVNMFKESYKNYKSSLTPEQVETLKDARNKKKLRKKNITLKKKQLEFEKPKKPASAYIMYYTEKFSELDASMNLMDKMKTLANQWKLEDEDVKKKYTQDYIARITEYKDKLKQWEEKMIELGNFDILGTRRLRKLHKQCQEKANS